jgi:hypothetical protein
LWALALILWVAQTLLVLLPILMLETTVGTALAQVPDTGAARGDMALIALETLRPIAFPLAMVAVVGALLGWQLTVVWRAGVVAWQLWVGGGPPRLAQILGLGLAWWWRYLRLSLTAAAALVVLCTLIWLPITMMLEPAHRHMAEGWIVVLLSVAVALTVFSWLLIWASSLRGAWVLGRPGRRSAVAAWCRGLVDSIRQPLSSFGVLVAWGLAVVVLSALPLAASLLIEGLRGTISGLVLLHLCVFAGIWCRIALFTSYAPVSGLVDPGPKDTS